MTDVGPMFLAAVLAETFEHFGDDAHGQDAGRLLHEALTRHGYRLAPIEPKALERAERQTAVADAVERHWWLA